MNNHTLVIDDDEKFLRLVTHLLAMWDMPVITVTNGPEALDILRERHQEIGLVLLDIALPAMNGYEICRIIRTELNLTELPILALTALAGFETEQKVLEVGMNAMLPKPFKGPQLMDMLTNLGMFDSEETT
jgi:two-component system chemotaxis sensor kinase CheA